MDSKAERVRRNEWKRKKKEQKNKRTQKTQKKEQKKRSNINAPWKNRVWNRENATPTLRSSSCLASTASLSSLFGTPSDFMARTISSRFTALNLARYICCPCLCAITGLTQRMTSKHIFSPSRSQSSHNTSESTPLPSFLRMDTMEPRVGIDWMGASNKSAGAVDSQSWYSFGKSVENTCPVTEVTR